MVHLVRCSNKYQRRVTIIKLNPPKSRLCFPFPNQHIVKNVVFTTTIIFIKSIWGRGIVSGASKGGLLTRAKASGPILLPCCYLLVTFHPHLYLHFYPHSAVTFLLFSSSSSSPSSSLASLYILHSGCHFTTNKNTLSLSREFSLIKLSFLWPHWVNFTTSSGASF